jgi:hypothetical protein
MTNCTICGVAVDPGKKELHDSWHNSVMAAMVQIVEASFKVNADKINEILKDFSNQMNERFQQIYTYLDEQREDPR